MSEAKQVVTQRELCKELLEALGELLDRVERTPKTQKIVALCTAKLNNSHSLLDQAQIEHWALIHKNWMITLIWVLKFESKVLRQIDWPFYHPEFQFFEPFGRKIHAELLLWDDCLTFIDKFGFPQALDYSTAIDGWYATTQERMRCAYQNIFHKTRKRVAIDFLKREIALLKKNENPNNPQQKPHLYNLIEVARTIEKANPSDDSQLKRERHEFGDFKWKAYIAACRNWYQRFNGDDEVMYKGEKLNPLLAYVEDGKLKVGINGRQTLTIYPPVSPSFLKQPRKKKTLIIGSL